MQMKTFLPNPNDVQRAWHLVDAADQPLGRLAVRLANLLRGRGKAIYTPHVDTGDFVIVVNAEKVKLTGRKEETKEYATYSGFRGGRTVRKAGAVRATKPESMIELAVRGMLPRNHLCRSAFARLKVYAGPDHPHAAQAPKPVALA
jgi:large subunit ribosomal protein L13